MGYVRLSDLETVKPQKNPECKTGFTGEICNDVNPGFTKMLPRQIRNLLGIGAPRCVACGAQGVPLVTNGNGKSVLFCARCAAGGWAIRSSSEATATA